MLHHGGLPNLEGDAARQHGNHVGAHLGKGSPWGCAISGNADGGPKTPSEDTTCQHHSQRIWQDLNYKLVPRKGPLHDRLVPSMVLVGSTIRHQAAFL